MSRPEFADVNQRAAALSAPAWDACLEFLSVLRSRIEVGEPIANVLPTVEDGHALLAIVEALVEHAKGGPHDMERQPWEDDFDKLAYAIAINEVRTALALGEIDSPEAHRRIAVIHRREQLELERRLREAED